MANSNQNNRPDVSVRLGTVDANANITMMYAHKSFLLKGAALVSGATVPGSAAIHINAQLSYWLDGAQTFIGQKANSAPAVGQRVFDLNVPDEFEVPKGAVLVLVLTDEAGSFNWGNVNAAIDYQVRGN